MATLQEILARAQALREETALGSISPERAGSIMYDTLQQINQMQLEGGSLVISKIYASVSAMEADDAPVSDLTGQALRQGQLVVIVPSDTSSSDLGSVYRYNGTTGGASSWSFTGKIGGYPMDQTPTQGSTRAVTSGGVYEQITQLGQKLENVEVVDDSSSDEVIEFQEDDGTFIASVSAEDGVKSKGFVIKDENGENPINLYTEENDDDRLAFGDANGNDIVLFSDGEVLTKNFDSRVIAPALRDIEQLKRQNSGDSASERKNDFLPDFYSYKKGKSGGWFDRLRLMHFSDTHNNSTNLAEALSLSQGLVDAVIDTGDNANGIASTVASSTIAELQNYVNVGRNNNPTPMPLLICNGNHDVPNLTKKQYYDIMCDYMSETAPGFVFGDSEGYRSYGYYDITPNSTIGAVRIIALDPFDYADGQFMNPYGTTGVGGWMNCVFSQKQINWLIATLRSAVASGYKVITAMHYSWGDNTVFTESGSANPDANYHQDPFMIPDIIDAMQNKTTLSKSYPDDENINNITINEDFSGINDFHYICHLFGHIHSENEYQCQKTDGSKFYNILMVGAPNMGSEGLAINKVPLQPGTTNSIKLTVLEIDTVEKAIYRVNYGAYKAFDMSITERTKKIPYTFND